MKIHPLLLAGALVLLSFGQATAQDDQARLLRFPAVSQSTIAFSYAGDLYSVPVTGGQAVKLTSHIGYEVFPKFSPDGKTIAFTGQYDGNTEVYAIPTEGGEPQRITYTATLGRDNIGDRMGPNNIVMGWTPDGKEIIFRTRWYTFSGLRGQIMHVPAQGGELRQLPTSEGGFCSYSANGKQLAMNRMFREFRTWKYYRGGQSDDIWIHDVGTTKLTNITNTPAQDIFPMWIGNEIYFLSDRDSIMNMFCYNTQTKATEKITHFDKYDVKFPANSQQYIVFENGGFIYKYTLATKKVEKVDITLQSDNVYARSEWVSAQRPSSYSMSPDGMRLLVGAHGDLFSVPATHGTTYNLTLTPGVHERNASWSPDGKWIAYFSDKTGEYQLYVMPWDQPDQAVALTQFAEGYPGGITWDPQSKGVYFTTDKRELYYADLTAKTAKCLFQTPSGGLRGFQLSPDGQWITYASAADNKVSVVYLYNVASGVSTPVTTSWYDSSSPIFSENGKYLFFSSARSFRSSYSRVEWNANYDISSYVFVIPLAADTPDPTTLTSDEYSSDKAAAEKPGKPAPGGPDKAAAPKSDDVPVVKIDLDGIVERASALPLQAGFYQLIGCIGDDLYYSVGNDIKKISMKDMKVSDAGKGRVMAYVPKAKKALMSTPGPNGGMSIVNVPGFRGEQTVDMSQVKVYVNYTAEWAQIFNETWRVFRDGFYLPTMHGRDWNFIHDKYAELLPYVKHRHDLTYVIGEMISELNIGHSYVTSPASAPAAERVQVGLLGGKFAKDKSGYFKITKIFKGENWDASLRSPLYENGLDVAVGDYILAIDGVSTAPMKVIYEALVGKVGATVALKVNSSPNEKGARTIYVKPVADEAQLAYYEWVQTNIEKVNKASNGEIGYIHIPDMSGAGLDMFTKLFYTQLNKKALIIDDRMNGGGNVSPIILERLGREAYRMSMSRNGGVTETVPNESHYGPKVCLIDKYSSSDGDLFPYSFREMGLGKLIGKRTWGGIVGISGSKPYLDGQDVRTPFFTSYSMDGEWIIEGHGVDPDIEVDINPFEDFLGTDAQLNKAIEVLKEELKNWDPLPEIPADRKM